MNYYDLYIPIGNTCRTAYHLRKNDLRLEAYPLDWQKGYSLDTVIHLFKTKFDDFFAEIEDESDDWDGAHRKIRDIKNNIVSIHHFEWEKEVKQSQKEFQQKMRKRYKSMDDKINKAKRVVLLCYRTDSIDKIKSVLKEFSNIYPHLEIRLINMRNNDEIGVDSYERKTYVINDKLSIEDYSINDTYNSYTCEKADWSGNVAVWRDVLKNYYNDNRLEIKEKLKGEKDIVIYGAGGSCQQLVYKLQLYDISIKGIAVTDIYSNPKSVRGYDVKAIEKYDKEDRIIISVLDRNEAEIIKNMLLSKGFHNINLVDNYMFLYGDYCAKIGFAEQN